MLTTTRIEKGGLVLAGQDTVPGFAEEVLKRDSLLCSFSQSSEHDRQKRNFLLPGQNQYAHFNIGQGLPLLICQFSSFLYFFPISSCLLLSQKAQMLVALGCLLSSSWAPSRVCGFLSPAVVCCFLWDMLWPMLCRGTFSAWAELPAVSRRQLLTNW